jgi:hypothetical protein
MGMPDCLGRWAANLPRCWRVGSTDSAADCSADGVQVLVDSMRLCSCTGHDVRHSCVGCILLGRMVFRHCRRR